MVEMGKGGSRDQMAKARQAAQRLLEATEPSHNSRDGWRRPVRSSAYSTTRGHVDHPSRGRSPLAAPRRGREAMGSTAPPVRSMAHGYAQEESIELQVDQKWVGWILGAKGANMKDIEAESGAKVSIDQATKELGYSVVKMAGSASAVLRAQRRIQASLAIVEKPSQGLGYTEASSTQDTRSFETEEMEVEQRCVGWLLGCKGIVMKEIEQKSGARVSIDQSTKDQGFSTVKMKGSEDSIATARLLVEEKIAQADPAGRRERDASNDSGGL